MYWIGITGVMGAGKTTVSRIVEGLGHPVAYADEFARMVVSEGSDGLEQVVQAFGPGVLSHDRTLDRAALGRIVFGKDAELKKLEAIVHPRIQSRVLDFIDENKSKGHELAFYDVPLLFEKGLESNYDSIICVISDEAKIIERLKLREKWDESEIRRRLQHQWPQEKKVACSQYIVDNSGTEIELRGKVEGIVSSLLTSPKMNPQKK